VRVLVTGASGFLGRALRPTLAQAGHALRPAVRAPRGLEVEAMVGKVGPETDWREALAGWDIVIHLAARVHIMRDDVPDPVVAFRSVNTHGTLNLARQAAEAAVKRLVCVSTVKVHGEGRDVPYSETDPPEPRDAYAISKWEAEQGLHGIARESGLQVVVLRPPLVYGPGVGANFLRLLCGSLVVDTGHLKRTLDWTPPFTLAQGLNETVEWYARSGRTGQ